jgi:hypothetical protein
MSWYARFHDFALMLAIYPCPLNAMDKLTEMDNEWDDQSMPLAF